MHAARLLEPFAALARGTGVAAADADVARHPVQPAGDGRVVGQGARLVRQGEEHRLAGVLGIGAVADDAPAGAEHHQRMPAHQLGERRLAPGRLSGGEGGEQQGVAARIREGRVRAHGSPPYPRRPGFPCRRRGRAGPAPALRRARRAGWSSARGQPARGRRAGGGRPAPRSRRHWCWCPGRPRGSG